MINIVLINLSNGLLELNEGEIFISRRCGLKFESNNISKPNISKQTFLFLLQRLYEAYIGGSCAIHVFIATSLILAAILLKS